MIRFDHRSGTHVHVDGARIYCEIQGNAQAPPLLLLHGGFGTMDDWASLLPTLAMTFRVIGIDFRGHGASTLGSAALTYERHERDVMAVLAQLGIDAVTVFGFSDGGTVGCRLAAASRVRVERLVVVAAHWQVPDASTRAFLTRITGDSWRHRFPQSVATYDDLNPEPDFDALARAVVALWTDQSSAGYPGESVSAISSPVLIVRGDDDHLVSIEDATGLRRRVAGARLLNVPFAGHAVHEDQPEICRIALQRFLQAE